MSKFKVGDRVLAVANIDDEQKYRPGTLTSVTECGHTKYRVDFDGWANLWPESNAHVKPLTTNKIIITSNGTTTTARLYDGKTVVKTAEAKCSPSDTYDFTIGANLAYDRLMRPAVTAQPTVAAQPTAAEYREVKRAAKVGEKIKIVAPEDTFGDYQYGDVFTVSKMCGDKVWEYGVKAGVSIWPNEYVVLEPITPTTTPDTSAEEKPQGYNGKIICVDDGMLGTTVGKIYTVINDKFRDDDGDLRPRTGGDLISAILNNGLFIEYKGEQS